MVGTRLYIGGLSYRVSEYDIDKFFKDFSGVGDIVIKNGFAFVEFDDQREADDAIYEMNGKELEGGRVTVEKAKGTPRNSRFPRRARRGMMGAGGGRSARGPPPRRFGLPSRTKYRLTVSNLSSKVSWQDLKDFMRQAGEVTYADAHKQQKNEGVIEFATRSDMRNAIYKLDGKDLRGRNIRLIDEGGNSRGGRSRSHSRSRSRYSRSVTRSRSRSLTRSRSRSRVFQEKDHRNKYGSESRSRTRSRSNSKSRSRSSVHDVKRSRASHSITRSPDRSRNSDDD